MRRTLSTGELETAFHSSAQTPFVGFVVGKDAMYIALQRDLDSDAADLVAVRFADGSMKDVAHVDHLGGGFITGFAVSPDGKSLLVNEVEKDNSDVYLMPLSTK
jgi:hypothetical protein